jgi:hypothetical protein
MRAPNAANDGSRGQQLGAHGRRMPSQNPANLSMKACRRRLASTGFVSPRHGFVCGDQKEFFGFAMNDESTNIYVDLCFCL